MLLCCCYVNSSSITRRDFFFFLPKYLIFLPSYFLGQEEETDSQGKSCSNNCSQGERGVRVMLQGGEDRRESRVEGLDGHLSVDILVHRKCYD